MWEWVDISIHGLLFQWASTTKIQLSVLVKYKVDPIIISLKINLFSPWYSWKIAELALNNNHSLEDVMVNMLSSSTVDHRFNMVMQNQKLSTLYWLFLCEEHSIKEYEQRLVRPGWCVWMEWHVYPTHRLLFQWAISIKLKQSLLV